MAVGRWLLILVLLGTRDSQAAAPTNLNWTAVSSDTASTSWSGNADPSAAYVAAISTVSGFVPVKSSGTTALDQQTTSYVNLNPNTTHYFKVKISTDLDADYAAAIATVTAIETPQRIYIEEISTTSLVVSAYAPSPGFTNLGQDSAGINVASAATYMGWISSNAWATKDGMPSSRRAAAVAMVDGKIYVIGGHDVGPGITGRNDVYNPATNTWQTKTAMPTARRNAAAAVVGGKIYVMGGENPGYLTTNEMYDPETDAWETKTSMPTSRSNLIAEAVDGKIYAIGGVNGPYRNETEMYDPQTNAWTNKTVMPTARMGLGSAVVDGKIYAIGGFNGGFLSTVEEYDPQANSWSAKTSMDGGRYQLAAAALGGKIYALGGCDVSGDCSGATLSTHTVYDPQTNAWMTGPILPSNRKQPVAAAAAGKIYAIGGSIGGVGGEQNTNEEYDPGVARKISGLSTGSLHSFKAKTRNSAGRETAETAALSSYTAVFAPGLVSTGTYVASSSSSLDFSWTENGNAPGTSYYAWISTGSSALASNWMLQVSTGFTGLLANTTYFAYAKARNADLMETHWTALGSTATLANPPITEVSTFSAVNVSSLALQWQANANPAGTAFIAEISSVAGFAILAGSSQTV
ncbi:MAG: hypothetical protein HYT79_11680, partial [Elusimicrobia bacterium]|nr:hypothetical protein [Elusimicrobiota bacterium]